MDALITAATSADERQRGAKIAVLPVGSFEQHGAHLPLTTDTVVAGLIAQRIATDYDLFLLPPVTVSCSHEHAHMPGTVSISAATLYAVINDIRKSLQASGVPGLLIVNGHGGNYVLSNVVQEANTSARASPSSLPARTGTRPATPQVWRAAAPRTCTAANWRSPSSATAPRT
ncbi:creatininase family protein [Kitasatospora sp. NBC_00085]|uniref:creatininase family protein n=1 Tax=Kitasatospora sp. NBC_00085 TaxID=2903566 RepID=UPI00386A93F6